MRTRALGLLFALLTACAQDPAPNLPPPTMAMPPATAAIAVEEAHASEDAAAPGFDATAYQAAIAEGVDAWFAAEPVTATHLGDHRFDGRWPDLSDAGLARTAQDLKVRAQALRNLAISVPETTTAPEAETDRPALDATVLADVLETRAYLHTVVKPFERNPSEVLGIIGSAMNAMLSHPYAPVRDRIRALDARLENVPALLVDARAQVKRPTKASMENLAIVAAGLAHAFRNDIAKYDAKDLAGDAALRERLNKHATGAAAAIEAYAADLAKAFPAAKLINEGIGAEAWATLARLREGVTESPVEIRKMGEAELVRLTRELDQLLATAARKGETRAQFLARLETDAPKPDKVLDDYRAANKGVEEWLRAHPFATVPWDKAKLQIVPSPPHLRGVSLASMNPAGPLEAISDAKFEVNAPDAFTPPDRRAALLRFHAHGAEENISIHEALPGHYLQFLHQREAKSKVRKLVWASTTGEGWAHYCEQALVDMGYASPDPVRAKAFYLRSALQRAARIVVDVAENDGSMTVESAAKFFEENALLAPGTAQIEARRAIVWPVNMFAYAYGKLHILELREKVRARDKDAFDLVSFHDRFLAIGAIPVRYIGPAAFGVD